MHPTTQLLNEYRSKVSFDQKEMTGLLYGPGSLYKNLQKINKVFADNENFADVNNKSRKQVLLESPKALAALKQNFNLLDINVWDTIILHRQYTVPASISYGMAVQAIKYLGSDEQNSLWMPKFETSEIISAYAQTEIGHGSDIQSLETTATLENDSFILNSPTISSTKFWPGDLGLLANHAVVYAQLIINGKSKGVFPFFVQIRDTNTNKPLNGVTVGDIGPKLGYVSKDNGFLSFNNVKVPKTSLLNRYIQIDKDGNFKKIGNDKISYASMMLIRKILISIYPRVAAKALTIAIRYSIVRQQFRNDNGVENSVLEYQTQQEKLIPRLAQLYALIFAGLKTQQIVDDNFECVQKGDFSKLQQTHVILASGKSWSSYWVSDTAEWCRLSCGGHGFAHYSGLPAITFETAPNVTLEGENQVLMLQVAKYLLKLLTQTSKKHPNKITHQFQYILEADQLLNKKSNDLDHLVKLNALLPLKFIERKLIESKKDIADLFNYDIGIHLLNVSNRYFEYLSHIVFLEYISKASPKTQGVLKDLHELFLVTSLIDNPNYLIQSGHIQPEDIQNMRKRKIELMNIVKDQAIGLVDAFEYTDKDLGTHIGNFDGKPYERMYEWATTLNSINQIQVYEGVQKLKNIKLKSKL